MVCCLLLPKVNFVLVRLDARSMLHPLLFYLFFTQLMLVASGYPLFTTGILGILEYITWSKANDACNPLKLL